MGGARALLLVLCVLMPAAAAQADCAPKEDARTLVKNRDALVIAARRAGQSRFDGRRTIVWGCLRSGRRWQRIRQLEASGFYVDAIRRLRLVGRRLAYVWEQGDPRQDIAMGVHVYDLGARRRTTDVGTAFWPEIARLVLSRSGAVAFSVNEYEFEGEPGTPPRQHRRIHRARGNRTRVLDDGPDVRLDTLRLRGTRLTWRHGDETRRATLR
jgi:hypothetical protein